MSRKSELLQPDLLEKLKEYYKTHTLSESAKMFGAAHETIKNILVDSGVTIRQQGQHTDRTKVYTAAYRCAKLIREYPKDLHEKILTKTKEYII